MSEQIQVKFVTKQEKYAIPNTPYFLPGTVTGKELNLFINSVLKGKSVEDDLKFDFLIFDELLRLSLQEHLDTKGVSSECSVEIEYFVKYPAPSPDTSLAHDDWVSAARAAGDWILSGCYDNTLHIWNVEGEHKLTIPGHLAPIKSVAWIEAGDPVSTFVSTSHDATVMLWQWNKETNSVECVNVGKGHAKSVDCVDVNAAQNRFATGSYDQMLKIWSTDLNELPDKVADEENERKKFKGGKVLVKTPLMTLSGHTDGISGVQWTDSNEICTCSMDCTLRVWDLELGGMKTQLNGSKAFLDLSYSQVSKLIVTASTDKHIRLWDSRSKDGNLVKGAFSSHTGWVSAVCWSPTDEFQFVSGSFDNFVKMWDTRSPKVPLFDMCGHEDKVFAVDWSLKNLIISGGTDNCIKIYKHKVAET